MLAVGRSQREHAKWLNESEFIHRTATVDGLDWHWVEMGQGDAVVLLHGIPESWRCWHKQMPALARQFRVIAPDMKGYGRSDKKEGDYSGSNVARETLALLDHLGVDTFHLAGHDWGVMIADNICNQVPDRVERYVRCCLSLHNYDQRNSLHHQWNGRYPDKATRAHEECGRLRAGLVRYGVQAGDKAAGGGHSAALSKNSRTTAWPRLCRAISETFERASLSTIRNSPCRCFTSTESMIRASRSSMLAAWKITSRASKRFWFSIAATSLPPNDPKR